MASILTVTPSGARGVDVPIGDLDDDRGRRRPGSWRDDGVGQRGLARGGGGHRRGEDGKQQRGRGGGPDPRPRLVRLLSFLPDEQAQPPGPGVARCQGRGCPAERRVGNGTGVRVGQPSGGDFRADATHAPWSGARCHHPGWSVRCGLVGRVGRPPRVADPEWSLAVASRRPQPVWSCRRISAAPDRTAASDPLVSGTLVGAALVAVGLGFAFLVVETPLVSRLVPSGRSGSTGFAGTDLSSGRSPSSRGPACRWPGPTGWRRPSPPCGPVPTAEPRSSGCCRACPRTSMVATDVMPNSGRPIPELVVGPFGVAVVHELGPREAIRRVGQHLGGPNAGGLGADRVPARARQP